MKRIKKKEFERLYYSMTNKDLSIKLGIPASQVVYLVKKSGIKPKGKAFRIGRKVMIVD